jgi:hypothetical protein
MRRFLAIHKHREGGKGSGEAYSLNGRRVVGPGYYSLSGLAIGTIVANSGMPPNRGWNLVLCGGQSPTPVATARQVWFIRHKNGRCA